MLSVALLSRWHVHADDYAKQVMRSPNMEIRMVWDELADRGSRWADDLGVPFEPVIETVLAHPEIDAVIVTTPTSAHYDVIMAAIRAGKHVFTEKVLAFTRRECTDILTAAEEMGVRVMVSLPRLTDSYYLYTQNALDQGLLGRLTSVRCRLAHNGALPTKNSPHGWLPAHFFDVELCGGGALIDLGAHPIYLANRLAGNPIAVTARLISYLGKGVDDSSAAIVEYESGALGIVEAGFVAGTSPFVLEAHGTEGTVVVEDGDIRVRSTSLPANRWYDATELQDDLPTVTNLPTPIEQWVQWITNAIEPSIQAVDVIGLTVINEAAAESHATGKRVTVSPL